MEESELKLGLVSINNQVDLSDLMFCLRSSGTGCDRRRMEGRGAAAALPWGTAGRGPGTGAATRLRGLRLLNSTEQLHNNGARHFETLGNF